MFDTTADLHGGFITVCDATNEKDIYDSATTFENHVREEVAFLFHTYGQTLVKLLPS